ncbi:MAG: DUF4402 domain-containing protein [Sphingomicrobium sp.]|nr:DUF4402 domain-containing protein [Sphingomonadales bacterium]
MVRVLPALAALAAAAALAPVAAFAAPIGASPPATGNALLIYPVTITKTADLDFGLVTVTTAGTAIIDPNANTIASSGGVVLVGTQWHAAEFVGAARSSSVVNIKLPNQPITLTRQGGTETMTVSPLTLQGQSKRSIAAATSFSFRVGGTLNVGANQAEGTYTGTFDVEIQYP